MNKHAIFHNTTVPYAYAKDKNTLCIRIRTAREDMSEVKVHYKCRYDWENPFCEKTMKLFAQTDLFDFYEVDVQVEKNRYKYYFELTDRKGKKIYLDERGLKEEPMEIPEATGFQYAYIGEADVYHECKWMQEAVVYQIFPDRFCNGDISNDPENTLEWGQPVSHKSMFGGDLQGIIDKLDYLQDLGIDLIYLTPIFKSTSNHKYNTADYYEIDPQFGTVELAKELVKKCHERGIRIIFDAVFNHSGSDFFAFKDLLEKQEKSKYKDWYFIDEYPVSLEKINYYTFARNVRHMPKLNTANPEVKEYLLKVGEYWVKEVGIDGWRLDVCDEIDHEFWRDFRKRIKAVNKEAVIVGEIQHEAVSFLNGDQLDSIMNYPFRGALVDFFAKRSINEKEFDNIVSMNRAIYMSGVTRQLWNLFGSHDTPRFLYECNENVDRMKLAIVFQFCFEGVPYIYYGDEVGITGGNDPLNRACMIWDEDKQNKELLQLYKKLIKIRKENKELVYGDYKPLYLEDNVIIFERNSDNGSVIIAINNNEEDYVVNNSFEKDSVDLISGESISLKNGISLKKMEFKILKVVE
ncbi:MAG: alpha-glycosidase [Clostridiales bacterium]|uniref:glycoside hydrolase family 13 protein n=1 Tax=Clostridium sp. N3C TaxID=1776758 RepID=UPI00092DEAB6|nr:glycoside hydrolase family 13 protein [Clostridium sp. N3C]NLZ48381.1 alpha-glycosidase [Clostridiales bacterium]SCN24564.1 Cyclomaltodextrinase [Clostridium sp. N3C]